MASTKTISAAIKLIDLKKENLRKAFEDLQALSSSLSSFTLTWSDLDSHFTSLQNSIEQRFNELKSKETNQSLTVSPQSQPSKPSSSSKPPVKSSGNSVSVSVSASARLELKSFCEKMDGKGLRKYINEHHKERDAIRVELSDAFRCALDPAELVLGAMDGFYLPNSKGDRDPELGGARRSCILLLEELMGISPEIKPHVEEKAKMLALEWIGKVNMAGDSPLEALGLLQLLASYGLVSSYFNMGDLLDCVVIVARYRQAPELCRVLGFTDKIPDLIQKLISKGKQLLAVKFIFEFELIDKFPPVPILKGYVKESKKLAQKVRKDGKNSLQSLNQATSKEVSSLNSVIKYIKDHKLESEYPPENLEKRIEQLEKQKADRKRPAAALAPKPPQQPKPQHQSGSKRPRTTGPATPPAVAGGNPAVPSFHQSHPQSAGLLPVRPAPYLSSSTGPYGLAGSTPTVAPYTGSSAGLYGLTGAPMGFPGNLSPPRSHLYSSESHLQSGYYDRPTAYGGYGLPPQYHQSSDGLPPQYHTSSDGLPPQYHPSANGLPPQYHSSYYQQ